jgi:hypothetical protein
MDRQRDFAAFQKLMDQLCAALRGWREAGDAFINAYWDALRDVPLAEVQANVKRIIATATKDTPFPKPRDLRDRAPAIENVHDSRRDAATRVNETTWRELRATDPVRFQIEFGIARAAREMAAISIDDPGFAECQREYQHWNSVRFAPREVQEAAVARYAGQP